MNSNLLVPCIKYRYIYILYSKKECTTSPLLLVTSHHYICCYMNMCIAIFQTKTGCCQVNSLLEQSIAYIVNIFYL